MLIDLCREFRFRLHIVHLSTAHALPMLAAAKAEGLPLTVETCPHFLHCCRGRHPRRRNALQVRARPSAARANRDQLWDGTAIDGTHRPHRHRPLPLPAGPQTHAPARRRPPKPGEEPGRFDQAWGGIASLSTALSVVWTQAHARGFTLNQLAQWTSSAPAALAGLSSHSGSIAPGMNANLVAFDPDAHLTVTPEILHYRHKISPYMGERLRGVVR